ncbi:hypothetical protein IAT40_001819 [Kwoniella sp. CBS 6097]
MADLVKNGEPSNRPAATQIPDGQDNNNNDDSIPLYVVNGVATVWDAQVAATLHCVHNISGIRAGTLPGVAQQNGFLGLPLTLMKEEAAYLVQGGIAHLIVLPTFPPLPSSDQLAKHTAARKSRIEKQEALARQYEDQKKVVSAQAFEKGGEKARAKREARAKAKAEKEALKKVQAEKGEDGLFGAESEAVVSNAEHAAGLDISKTAEPSSNRIADIDELTDTATSTQDSSLQPPTSTSSLSSFVASAPAAAPASASTVPSTASPSPGHFHVIPSQPSHPDLVLSNSERITSLPHPSFPFPSTPRDIALLGVFTSLQRRGYRMGLGPRFGGEYLIYPGDYLRYHAHFTSQVLVDDQHIRPAEIVAWGRLGTGTKKAGLICSYDERNKKEKTENDSNANADELGEDDRDRVEYYSLEWANFG